MALLGGVVAVAALGTAAPAQSRGSITGRVTDTATAQPLAAVRLELVEIGQATLTDQEGRYRFRALADGSYTLRVIAIGYHAQVRIATVSGGGSVSLDLALTASPFTLDELITTATGSQRRVELGHTIATLRADSLALFAPVSTLSAVLQGRTAGVTILPSSGTTGTGSRIRIRGANSVSLSNEPLLYVDGIKVNNGVASSILGTGGQAPSRLNDLNPEEIESIEVVKGPSASTLYGTEAANGVIRITTKRGAAGRAAWNFWAEGGAIVDPSRYPDNFRSIGRTLTNGAPGGNARTCLLTQIAAGVCVQDSLARFNVLENKATTPIGMGHRQQFGGSVGGGSELAQYFVSGEYEGETGTLALPDGEERRLLATRSGGELPDNVTRPNRLKKVSLRTNLVIHPTPTLDVTTSVGYVSSDTRLPQNDNNVLGVLPSGYFGVASASDTAGNGGWGFFQPGEIFSLLRNQSVERFTGSASANWRQGSWLAARATVGYDIANRTDISFDPFGQGPAFGTTPLGLKQDGRTQLRTYTADASATAIFRPGRRIESRTSVGTQFFKDAFFQNIATGQRLTAGSEDIDGAAILTAAQTTTTTTTLGAFVEQQFGFNDRLFFVGAVRVDDNSAFGRDFDVIAFPKASLSYVISDEPFFPRGKVLGLLRLRAAFGTSGLQPVATDALTFFTPTASAVAGVSTSAVTFGGFGLEGLKPERSREVEVGWDAQLFEDRLNIEATFFYKKTRDALVSRVLAPSFGVSATRRENLGSVSNRGFEVTVNSQIAAGSDFSWNVTASGSTTRNRLVELGPGIPPVVAGNQRHTPGTPLGGFWDRPITGFADGNGNGIVELSEITVGDTAVFLGSPIPSREAALMSVIGLFGGRLRIQGQLDYQGGFVQYNSTEEFRCISTGNNCRALHDPSAPLVEQARAVSRRLHPSATTAGFIEDAEFLKLRELSVTWTVPDRWARALGATRVTVTAAGRNLATWTGYGGVDPEVNGAGQNALNGFGVSDFLTQPPVRTLLLRLNAGY